MCDLCARNSSYVRVSKRAVRCHRWRRSNARMRQRHEIDNNVDHRTDNNIASDHTQTLSAVFRPLQSSFHRNYVQLWRCLWKYVARAGACPCPKGLPNFLSFWRHTNIFYVQSFGSNGLHSVKCKIFDIPRIVHLSKSPNSIFNVRGGLLPAASPLDRAVSNFGLFMGMCFILWWQ